MDCGYFTGSAGGLLYFPTKWSEDYRDGRPYLIPWSELCEEEDKKVAAHDAPKNVEEA